MLRDIQLAVFMHTQDQFCCCCGLSRHAGRWALHCLPRQARGLPCIRVLSGLNVGLLLTPVCITVLAASGCYKAVLLISDCMVCSFFRAYGLISAQAVASWLLAVGGWVAVLGVAGYKRHYHGTACQTGHPHPMRAYGTMALSVGGCTCTCSWMCECVYSWLFCPVCKQLRFLSWRAAACMIMRHAPAWHVGQCSS